MSVFFLVTSTYYVPSQLVAAYESKIANYNPDIVNKNKTHYLHVLGAGYSLDPNLPATSQLSPTTLARLVEGIRIARQLPNYKIITSGYYNYGLESQASVARRAAIELGIPSEQIKQLETPSNTAEEVAVFVDQFGTQKKVIVVTDALHLPRAIMLYQKAGITAIGAPATFQVKKEPNDYNGFTFPSYRSVSLMNAYLRERLKYWKDSL
ncbi:YdcF family protein [Flavobacterium lacus]|uniref:YdcF family protein n=1 Tax=Flavobacterium lacus TaxID=1353778 RepID=UPI0015EBB328|nr:YdcF family protein [Flavobacterium lacus]